MGKSALVQELQQPIISAHGLYISGKIDQYQRLIPFHSFLQAFHDLIQQLLTESTHSLNKWRERIQKALGSQGRVITDVLPELVQIVGVQGGVAKLEAGLVPRE